MKNYSVNSATAEKFILNYTVNDNQIIVNLASGNSYKFPYTVGLETILLKIMKEQILRLDVDEFKAQQEKLFSVDWYRLACINLMYTAFVPMEISNPLLPSCLLLIYINVMYKKIRSIGSKLKIEDLEKNKMFIDNEAKLNDAIKTNQNILSGISNKTKAMVQATMEEHSALTINSIHAMKYEDVKKMIENIEQGQQFDINGCGMRYGEAVTFCKKIK